MTAGQPVRLLLGIAVWGIVTHVGGHKLQPMVYLQAVRIVHDVHTLADVFLWHAVVVLVQHHVAVLHDRDGLPCLHLETDCGKRLEIFLLHLLEKLTA